MKICLVSDQLMGYHKNWSGAEMVCQHMSQMLQKEGNDVVFLTTSFGKKDDSGKIFQIHAFDFKNPFLKRVGALFSRILGIFYSVHYLRKTKPDIVHFLHSNFLIIPVMIGAWILRIPTAFTVLDYFIICSGNSLRFKNGDLCDKSEGLQCSRCISRSKLIERFLIRLLFKNLKGIITFTETSKDRLINHGIPAEKITVLYTYDLSEEFKVNFENEEKNEVTPNSVLFVGTFFKYKGLHIIIKAMKKVLSEVLDSKLIIGGAGFLEDEERIKKLVSDLGIKNSVQFVGRKKNEEVSELIFKSEIVVVPEQWYSDFGPLILVEAMALAKPIVASRIGGIPEFIKDGENGFLAKYDDPDQFAEKIIKLLKDKKMALEMGKLSRQYIRSFLNNNQNKKLTEFYQKIYR